MMKSKLLAAAIISVALTGAAKATPITYAVSEFFENPSLTFGQSIAGSITTDGTLGLLVPSNILDWNLVSIQFTRTFNPPNPATSNITQYYDYLGPLSGGSNPPNSVLTTVQNIVATPLTLALAPIPGVPGVSPGVPANFQINVADQFGPLFAAVEFLTEGSSAGPQPNSGVCTVLRCFAR